MVRTGKNKAIFRWFSWNKNHFFSEVRYEDDFQSNKKVLELLSRGIGVGPLR
jgi:hypothetical protein